MMNRKKRTLMQKIKAQIPRIQRKNDKVFTASNQEPLKTNGVNSIPHFPNNGVWEDGL
jgi:hypothetical protein